MLWVTFLINGWSVALVALVIQWLVLRIFFKSRRWVLLALLPLNALGAFGLIPTLGSAFLTTVSDAEQGIIFLVVLLVVCVAILSISGIVLGLLLTRLTKPAARPTL